MSTYQLTNSVVCEARFSMALRWRKIFRGFLFATIMGVPTIYTVNQGSDPSSVFLVALFIMGSLLVFGVDIEKIRWGEFEVWLSDPPDTYQKEVSVSEENDSE